MRCDVDRRRRVGALLFPSYHLAGVIILRPSFYFVPSFSPSTLVLVLTLPTDPRLLTIKALPPRSPPNLAGNCRATNLPQCATLRYAHAVGFKSRNTVQPSNGMHAYRAPLRWTCISPSVPRLPSAPASQAQRVAAACFFNGDTTAGEGGTKSVPR
ncbi:hypothetical protein B0H19DRAFT_1373892 [Mycena capillaripes]|nr:hypothetical protein B0H19DRAFT_1373892 [Mycena capillaripes]